jgi:hypothetical protein
MKKVIWKRFLAVCLCFLFVLSAVPIGLQLVAAEGNAPDLTSITQPAETDSVETLDVPTAEEPTTDSPSTEENEDPTTKDPAAEGPTTGDQTSEVPSAETPKEAPKKSSPKSINLEEQSDALDNADVYVRVNGTEQTGTFSLKPGLISQSVAQQDSAIKAQYGMTDAAIGFRKAVLVSGGVETEVSRVGMYENTIYYSLHDYDDTGVAVQPGEKIVLIYETIYNVNVTIIGLDPNDTPTTNPGGTVTVSSTVYGGDDLIIQTAPDSANLYRLESITYTSGSNSGTLNIANNAATMTKDKYAGDINLTVTFKIPKGFRINNVTPGRTDEYNSNNQLTYGHGDLIPNRYGKVGIWEVNNVFADMANYDLSNSVYDAVAPHDYDFIAAFAGKGDIYYKTKDGTEVNSPIYWLINFYKADSSRYRTPYDPQNNPDDRTMLPEDVAPYGTTMFYLQSEANTSFELNKLEINGQLMNIPKSVGQTTTNTIGDMTVKVYFESTGQYGNFWQNGDASYASRTIGSSNLWNAVRWQKTRTYYRITVENVTEDINVNYSFKRTENRELTVLGLRGIDRTGMSEENRQFYNWEYHYFYFVTSNNYHKYSVYYRSGDVPSNNLVLYSVKPGYNPYTVTTEMSYDGGVTKTSDGIRVAGSEASTAENAIASAGGRFNTNYRHWGKNSILRTKEETRDDRNLLLTALQNDANYNTVIWYAVALEQSDQNNQMLYLNASPYEYHVEYDLNGGQILEPQKLTSNFVLNPDGSLVDTTVKTVESADAYFNMPLPIPVKDGFLFEGWQLVRSNRQTATIYQNENGTYYTQQGTSYATEDTAKAAVLGPIQTSLEALGWQFHSETRQVIPAEGTTDAGITYTWSFIQQVERTYAPNQQFSLTEDNYANLAYVSGDPKSNQNQYFTFIAKYLSVEQSENTRVDYKVYVQAPEGTAGAVRRENGNYYSLAYHAVEQQLIGDTAVLNQYAPAHPEYYTYNEGYSRIKTTTTRLGEDGSIPENNELYLYYDYRYQILTVEEDTRGEYANYLKDFDITVTLTKATNSPIDVPVAGETVTYGDLEFTSDGTMFTATTTMAKATAAKQLILPYGWTYEVTGLPADGYTVSYENAAGSTRDNTGTLTSDDTVRVVYTKTDVSPTGILDSTVCHAALLSFVLLTSAIVILLNRRRSHNE